MLESKIKLLILSWPRQQGPTAPRASSDPRSCNYSWELGSWQSLGGSQTVSMGWRSSFGSLLSMGVPGQLSVPLTALSCKRTSWRQQILS